MIRRIIILAAAIFSLNCSVLPNLHAQEQSSGLKEVRNEGVSFLYSTRDFAGVKIEKVRKQTDQDGGVAEGIEAAHFCFNFKEKHPIPALEQGPRYFFPAYSFICVMPLKDPSVKDFGKAYPDLNSTVSDLQKILRERPGRLENLEDIPDLPYNDASPSFISKFQYLNFRSGSGILFLTQYSNELEPNPVNNEELTLDFQGLTKDGRYYIAARLAITHPSLPRGIDFTDHIKRDLHWNYLKKEAKQLDGFSEASFRPSMTSMKAMLASIHVE